MSMSPGVCSHCCHRHPPGLQDSMGSMERILRTPIPLAYTRHTSRFMVGWGQG